MTDYIRLRAHHLLCMLTYMGRGYTPGFVSNFDSLVNRINQGAHIRIVRGKDDVCGALSPDTPGYHCEDGAVGLRDTFAAQDLEALLGVPVRIHTRLKIDLETVDRMRAAFAEGDLRRACVKCPWIQTCDEIAENGFRTPDLRLKGKRVIPILAAA